MPFDTFSRTKYYTLTNIQRKRITLIDEMKIMCNPEICKQHHAVECSTSSGVTETAQDRTSLIT